MADRRDGVLLAVLGLTVLAVGGFAVSQAFRAPPSAPPPPELPPPGEPEVRLSQMQVRYTPV